MTKTAISDKSKYFSDVVNKDSKGMPGSSTANTARTSVDNMELKRLTQKLLTNPGSVSREEFMLLQKKLGYSQAVKLLEEGKKRKRQVNGVLTKITPSDAGVIQKTALPAKAHKKEEGAVQPRAESGNNLDSRQNSPDMPDNLKSGLEELSGIDLSDIRVHQNSNKPQQIGALAYTQGNDIYIAPGQEKHLPHEGWHAVQQKQGRVEPTTQMKTGVPVNDDGGLEKEADIMGSKAVQLGSQSTSLELKETSATTFGQRKENVIQKKEKADTTKKVVLYRAGEYIIASTTEITEYVRNNWVTTTPKGNIVVYKDGKYIICDNTGEAASLMNTGWTTKKPVAENEGTDKSGPSVTIPEGKGTLISYMGYHKITAKSSHQYKLKENAQKDNRYSIKKPEYYALIDDRIVIATKPNIGGNFEVSIGDYLDVTFENNGGSVSTYKCILGDIKGDDAPNPWGHYDGKGVVEIIYNDYKPPEGYNANKNNPWGKGRVISITKVGKYS